MKKRRVAILISGGGSNMVSLVKSMTDDHPGKPVLVLSNDPSAKGLKRAQDLGVETAVVNHKDFANREDFETALNNQLTRVEAEILCLAGFMRILTPSFIETWKGRCLNIHPSLLPKYKGLNTHERVLEAGDGEHGCTVHLVTPDLDEGPILGQSRVPVLPNDTTLTLSARVLAAEHMLYASELRRFIKS